MSTLLTWMELARRALEPVAHPAGPMKERIEETAEQIRKPDGSLVTKTTTTKTTTYPDGSQTLKTEEVPIPQAEPKQ